MRRRPLASIALASWPVVLDSNLLVRDDFSTETSTMRSIADPGSTQIDRAKREGSGLKDRCAAGTAIDYLSEGGETGHGRHAPISSSLPDPRR